MLDDETFKKMIDVSEELINEHRERITKAFGLSDDGKITVTITHTLAPSKAIDTYDGKAVIHYVMEKVREEIAYTVSERQMPLPLEADKHYKLKKE